jgi:hypothetical protein
VYVSCFVSPKNPKPGLMFCYCRIHPCARPFVSSSVSLRRSTEHDRMVVWTSHQYATPTALGLQGQVLAMSPAGLCPVSQISGSRASTSDDELCVHNSTSSSLPAILLLTLSCSGQLPFGRGVTNTDVPRYGEPIANNDTMNRVNSIITSGGA